MFGFGKKRKEEQKRVEAVKHRVDLCYSFLGAEAVALMPIKLIKPEFNQRDSLKLFLFVDAAIHTLIGDLLTNDELDSFVFENIFSATGVFKGFVFCIAPDTRQLVTERLNANDTELFDVVEAAESAVAALVDGDYTPGKLRGCLK